MTVYSLYYVGWVTQPPQADLFKRHYELCLIESIENLRAQLGMQPLRPDRAFGEGQQRGRLQLETGKETFGIVAIQPSVASDLNMHARPPTSPVVNVDNEMIIANSVRMCVPKGSTSNPKGKLFEYLAAEKQAVAKAIAPVHTK